MYDGRVSTPYLVSINGRQIPPAQATISVFDRGFLHGDSVYEVLRTHDGAPLFWPEHRQRLVASGARLGLVIEPSVVDTLFEEMRALLAQAPWGESYVRLVVTRGEGPLSLDPTTAGPPNRVIFAGPMPLVPPALRAEGCRLATFQTPRRDVGGEDPRAKSGNRTLAVKGVQVAREAGAYESLRVDPLGRVLEGGTSTFFGVRLLDGAPTVITPTLEVGILQGITRARVLEVATTLEIPAAEVTIQMDTLPSLSEAFITSSVRGIVPVRAIDALEYDAPGPITTRLVEGYARLMDRSVAAGGV